MPAKKSFFNNPWVKNLSSLLLVITLIVGVVSWTYSQESSIKEWTTKLNNDTKEQIKEECAKKTDYVRIEEWLKSQKEDIQEIKENQQKTTDKIDRLYELILQQQ